MASYGGHIEVVEALLKTSADPAITDNQGDAPMMAALRIGRILIVNLLQKSQQS